MKKLAALLLTLALCLGSACAEPLPAMADYAGSWHAVSMDAGGVLLPMDEMGMSIIITIENGLATIVEGSGDGALVTQGTAAVDEGVLVITFSPESPALVLQLHADGTLTYTETLPEGSTTICFERAE